jgi:hypothetical protein
MKSLLTENSHDLDIWRKDELDILKNRPSLRPEVHGGSEDHGNPAARLRFYVNRGSRILDIPYFQPALEPGKERVSGLLLIALHVDPEFAGPGGADTIDAAVVRTYLEIARHELDEVARSTERGVYACLICPVDKVSDPMIPARPRRVDE